MSKSNYLNDIFSLTGKVALVTGASRGIGKKIAESLSFAGANVIGFGRSDLLEFVNFSYVKCNISNVVDFESECKQIFDDLKKIDILVNAAGISLSNSYSEELFNNTLKTNLTSVFTCCKSVIPFMLKGKNGSIINITSIGSDLGFSSNPGYAASKGGLAALTRSLAFDYGKYQIRVNNIVPGYIKTHMTNSSFIDPLKNKLRSDRTMLERWGKTDDIVGAAIFLASDASSYITASDLVIDGGFLKKGL